MGLLRNTAERSNFNPINRYRIRLRDNVDTAISCEAGHVGDDDMAFEIATTMTWLKDGRPSRFIPQNTVVGSNGRLRSELPINFMEIIDEGIYQCVFADTAMQGGEYLFIHPGRIDASMCWRFHNPFNHVTQQVLLGARTYRLYEKGTCNICGI